MDTTLEIGLKLKDILQRLQDEVIQPVREIVSGISWPPGWFGVFKVFGMIPRIMLLIPVAERLFRELWAMVGDLTGETVKPAAWSLNDDA